jgi:hypothetical protein
MKETKAAVEANVESRCGKKKLTTKARKDGHQETINLMFAYL